MAGVTMYNQWHPLMGRQGPAPSWQPLKACSGLAPSHNSALQPESNKQTNSPIALHNLQSHHELCTLYLRTLLLPFSEWQGGEPKPTFNSGFQPRDLVLPSSGPVPQNHCYFSSSLPTFICLQAPFQHLLPAGSVLAACIASCHFTAHAESSQEPLTASFGSCRHLSQLLMVPPISHR